MSADYGTDKIKDKGRHEVYKFSNSVLPKYRSEGVALFLASTNDREAYWLNKLRIPKENRIILESDTRKISKVKRSNPGTVVLPVSTHQFFADPNLYGKYSPMIYCGLDYECMFTEKVTADLSSIAQNNLMMDGGVLYTNVVGNHEQKDMQEDYMALFLVLTHITGKYKRILGNDFDLDKRTREAVEEMLRNGRVDEKMKEMGKAMRDEQLYDALESEARANMLEHLPEGQLSAIRSHVVTELGQILMHHSKEERFQFTYMLIPGVSDVIKKYDININVEIVGGNPHHYVRNNLETVLAKIKEFNQGIRGDKKFIHRKHMELLEAYCCSYFRDHGMSLIPAIAKAIGDTGYAVSRSKAFRYTSHKNTQMLLDVMQVKAIQPVLQDTIDAEIARGLQIVTSKHGAFLCTRDDIIDHMGQFYNLMDASKRHYNRIKKKVGFIKDMFLQPDDQLTQRKDLGSAFRQPLTLALARKCVKANMTDDEISAKYTVGNWGRIRALRANLTKGYIKPDEPKVVKKKKKEKQMQIPGSKYLVSRAAYQELPIEFRSRLDYFRDEVMGSLSKVKYRNVRKAFAESSLDKMLTADVDPMRVYAFFDDVGIAILEGKRITPLYLNRHFAAVRDCESLTTVIPWEPKPIKLEATEEIKAEVRSLAAEGFKVKDLWPEYGQYFSTPKQMGAVIAWAHPNLKKKRQSMKCLGKHSLK
jgi:hypothetical protein